VVAVDEELMPVERRVVDSLSSLLIRRDGVPSPTGCEGVSGGWALGSRYSPTLALLLEVRLTSGGEYEVLGLGGSSDAAVETGDPSMSSMSLSRFLLGDGPPGRLSIEARISFLSGLGGKAATTEVGNGTCSGTPNTTETLGGVSNDREREGVRQELEVLDLRFLGVFI
jgi:hypothetical protein